MSIGATIRQRREEQSLTQDQVAARAGISKPYLSNIETGKVKNPPTDGVLRSLEKCLKFGAGELISMANLQRTPVEVRQEYEKLQLQVDRFQSIIVEMLNRGGSKSIDLDKLRQQVRGDGNVVKVSMGRAVPIINRVAAGYPANFTDLDYPPSVADEYVRCPNINDEQAFGTRVVGDSMEPLYHEGDIVVFAPNSEPRNGDDCFIRFEEDASTTFKRFYQDSRDTIRLQPLNDKYAPQLCSGDTISGVWPAVYRIEQIRRR